MVEARWWSYGEVHVRHMMGDEERILLKQDQEYRFSEAVVPKQAYQHAKDDASESLVSATGDVRLKVAGTGRFNIIALVCTIWSRVVSQVANNMHSIKGVRDLWRFKTVRVLLLFLGILTLYLLMRGWENYQNRSLVTKTLTEQSSGSHELTREAVKPVTPVVEVEPKGEATVPTAHSVVDERVAVLERAMEYSLATIEELNRDTARSRDQLDNLSKHALDMVTVWRQAVKAEQEARRIRQEFRYVVYGINPQRAWLMDKRGELVSVRVGSHLPGYGKILKIDAKRGKVVAEGAVISWGENDY